MEGQIFASWLYKIHLVLYIASKEQDVKFLCKIYSFFKTLELHPLGATRYAPINIHWSI